MGAGVYDYDRVGRKLRDVFLLQPIFKGGVEAALSRFFDDNGLRGRDNWNLWRGRGERYDDARGDVWRRRERARARYT